MATKLLGIAICFTIGFALFIVALLTQLSAITTTGWNYTTLAIALVEYFVAFLFLVCGKMCAHWDYSDKKKKK